MRYESKDESNCQVSPRVVPNICTHYTHLTPTAVSRKEELVGRLKLASVLLSEIHQNLGKRPMPKEYSTIVTI
jgi:hypothetical protein